MRPALTAHQSGPQVVDLLVLVPAHERVRPRVRHVVPAGERVPVRLLCQDVLGNDGDARIELELEHLEHEPGRRLLECHDGRGFVGCSNALDELHELPVVRELVVFHLPFEGEDHVPRCHGDAVAPHCLGVHLDRQLREVLVVLHALRKPGNLLVCEDGEVVQGLPHEGVAFLVGVARDCPGVGDPDGRGDAPAEHQSSIARDVLQCLGRGGRDEEESREEKDCHAQDPARRQTSFHVPASLIVLESPKTVEQRR